MKNLTINQLMVLLDIYRGTFKTLRHMETVVADERRLRNLGLIVKNDITGCEITEKGLDLVNDIRFRLQQ